MRRADGSSGAGSCDGSTATETPAATPDPATTSGYADGTVTGSVVSTRFGDVQVQVTISETGIEPSEIRAEAGDSVTLHLRRDTERTCAKEVNFFGRGLQVGELRGQRAMLVEHLAERLEGRIRAVMGRRRLDKKIDRLKNHYIVCGYGRIGRQIVLEW